MVPKLWLYLLATALAADLVISGLAHLSHLRTLPDGGLGTQGVLALAGFAALVVACVAGLGIGRGFVSARAELERREQVIAAAATMTQDWLWEADLDGRITYSSAGVTELLGYRADEVIGRPSHDLLFDEGSRAAARRHLTSARVTGVGWERSVVGWRHRDGSEVRLQGSAVALKDHKGRVIGYRGARRAVDADDRLRQAAEANLRVDTVLAERAVDMALQPVVSLADGRAVGVEALARFRDGRGPEQWFDDALACGRLGELDELAFTTATRLFEQLPETAYLSVNASPELLLDQGFRTRLCASGRPLDRLVIEITEHARVADYPALNAALDDLRCHRVRFAIDDTGAGYASLNHVLQLRPDIVKLDRALITGVGEDPARRSLITALVLLALEVGASVTGEGVETPDQLEALATLGVDHVQGYLLARPTVDRAEWDALWDRRWTGPLTVEH